MITMEDSALDIEAEGKVQELGESSVQAKVVVHDASIIEIEAKEAGEAYRQPEVEESDHAPSSSSRYNLRRKIRQIVTKVKKEIEAEGGHHSDSSDYKPDHDNNDSLSSSSSASSEDSGNKDFETKRVKRKTVRKRKTVPSSSNLLDGTEVEGNVTTSKYVHCKLDSCKGYKMSKDEYKEHHQLHASGQYKCNFCEVIEENVIGLSLHEREKHLHNRISDLQEEIHYCPRCTFETKVPFLYFMHFGEAHFDLAFPSKRVKRRKKANIVECKICKAKIRFSIQDEHFRKNHDTTGMDDNKIWKCPAENCTAYFRTEMQLHFHKAKVHKILPQPATVVDEDDLFFNDEEIVFGKSDKKKKGSFECKLCKKTFAQFYLLNLHRRNYHAKRREIRPGESIEHGSFQAWSELRTYTFVCPVRSCTKTFKTQENLDNHQKHHGSFKCQFCEVVKEYAPDLAVHETEHALRTEISTSTKRRKRPVPGSYMSTDKYKCARCPQNFNMEFAYIRHHLKTHLNLSTAIHKCPICNAESFDSKWSDQHFNLYHKTDGLEPSQIYRCDQCPAYFVKSNQLNQHRMKIHFGGSLECPECGTGKSYHSEYHLRYHMERLHPQCFPNLTFACDYPICKRRFATEKELDKHKLIHGTDNDMLVKCPKCDRMMAKRKLKEHNKRAHEVPAFVCPECGKGFRAKVGLGRHMEYHKDPDSWKYQCSTCGKKFAVKQKLEEHMRTHTKEKPFVCPYCGEKYAHRHNWRNHMKIKHKDEYHEEQEGRQGNFLSRKGTKKGDCIVSGTKQC